MLSSLRLGSFLLLAVFFLASGCSKTEVQRFGMVIGLKPEKLQQYKELHADPYPGVRDLLQKYNIRNFSIFLQEIDGKLYEFAYYEYTGSDYERDRKRLSEEPRNKEWLKVTDSLQIPLEGNKSWSMMERIFYND